MKSISAAPHSLSRHLLCRRKMDLRFNQGSPASTGMQRKNKSGPGTIGNSSSKNIYKMLGDLFHDSIQYILRDGAFSSAYFEEVMEILGEAEEKESWTDSMMGLMEDGHGPPHSGYYIDEDDVGDVRSSISNFKEYYENNKLSLFIWNAEEEISGKIECHWGIIEIPKAFVDLYGVNEESGDVALVELKSPKTPRLEWDLQVAIYARLIPKAKRIIVWSPGYEDDKTIDETDELLNEYLFPPNEELGECCGLPWCDA